MENKNCENCYNNCLGFRGKMGRRTMFAPFKDYSCWCNKETYMEREIAVSNYEKSHGSKK